MRFPRPHPRACPARPTSSARPVAHRRLAMTGLAAAAIGPGALGGVLALAPAASSATSPRTGLAPVELRTVASVLPARALPARSGVPASAVGRAVVIAASISQRRYAAVGGRFMVRLTHVPADSRCSFSAGAGVGSYAGSYACSGLFAHPGRVGVNASSVARRWTVRATVTTGTRTRRFAWVVSVSGRAPATTTVPASSTVPPTTSTVPPTTTTVPPTTSTVPPTTTTAPLPGGQPGSESSNWSGYSEQEVSGSVTEVGGTWTVPTLNCSATPNGEDAEWVGVDGTEDDGDLFQAGVNSSCQGGQQTSVAWYEDIQGDPPAPSVELSWLDISPGDSVTAVVSQSSPGSWQYRVTDDDTGQSASGVEPYLGPQSSADWIEEDPSIESGNGSISLSPYADFGTVVFSGLTLDQSVPSLDLGSDGIELVQHGGVLAVPSQALDGTFEVTYQGGSS